MINSASSNPYVNHTKNNSYVPPPNNFSYSLTPQESSSEEQNTYFHDEIAAFLELTKEAQEKLENKTVDENERSEKADEEGEAPRPDDNTRSLTRALVAAKTRDQVQSVMTDVYDHMREWQALAAAGDKEAIKVVRKLQKLIARGGRKIKDLNEEIVMDQRQRKAEANEKKQEAKRLEIELKEALRERKARERRYLQERDNNNEDDEDSTFGPTMAETEAKIRQLAAAKAALSMKTTDAGSTGAIDGMSVSVATGESGGMEGAEVSESEVSSED